MLLITKNDISEHRQISRSVKEATINQFIEDAQVIDLCPLLGEVFYFSIISNPTTYGDLLNEYTYEHNGVIVTSPGIKKVLSLFAYARYILHGSQTDTPFGYVEKQYQDGIQVSRSDRKEVYKSNQQTAMLYWDKIKDFLNRNQTDFPLWKSNCSENRRKFRLNKITR